MEGLPDHVDTFIRLRDFIVLKKLVDEYDNEEVWIIDDSPKRIEYVLKPRTGISFAPFIMCVVLYLIFMAFICYLTFSSQYKNEAHTDTWNAIRIIMPSTFLASLVMMYYNLIPKNDYGSESDVYFQGVSS